MARTVLITGSSSGIGLLTARLLAARGWNVAATARRPDALAGLSGERVLTLPLDVTDEASMAAAVAATVARFGTIDVLNNALRRLRTARFRRGSSSLRSTCSARRRCFDRRPIMRARRSGRIINLSSIGGRIASPYISAYYATKFAVEGLSESLRYELKAHGIRVKVIEPAHFKTAFIERALEQWATHGDYEPQVSHVKAWVAHSDARAPQADPVAEMIFTAATDASDRLRHPVHGRLMRAVHTLLPDAVWRSLMGAGMNAAAAAADRHAHASRRVDDSRRPRL